MCPCVKMWNDSNIKLDNTLGGKKIWTHAHIGLQNWTSEIILGVYAKNTATHWRTRLVPCPMTFEIPCHSEICRRNEKVMENLAPSSKPSEIRFDSKFSKTASLFSVPTSFHLKFWNRKFLGSLNINQILKLRKRNQSISDFSQYGVGGVVSVVFEFFWQQCTIMNVYAHRFAQITNSTYIKRNCDAENASQTIYRPNEWMSEWVLRNIGVFNISHNAIFDNWFDDSMYYVSYSLSRSCPAVCCYNEFTRNVFTSSSQ